MRIARLLKDEETARLMGCFAHGVDYGIHWNRSLWFALRCVGGIRSVIQFPWPGCWERSVVSLSFAVHGRPSYALASYCILFIYRGRVGGTYARNAQALLIAWDRRSRGRKGGR